jgi:diguanylate cyclase (GGDEF)-like protein/PAS domain S-box-containing protein
MIGWSADFIRRVLDKAPEGVVVCEARGGEQPVVYVNDYFQQLTGYTAAELLGTDLRRLQGGDRDQPGRERLRRAMQAGTAGRALLRNYRKDGRLFLNDVLIEPVHDDGGRLTHFVGFHREFAIQNPRAAPQGVPAPAAKPSTAPQTPAGEASVPTPAAASAPAPWQREDALTGLLAREHFMELLRLQWALGQRELRAVTLLMFDIKGLGQYNRSAGQSGGDAAIRRIADLLTSAFRRGADVIGRWEGGTFCVLAQSAEMAPTVAHARAVVQRVIDLQIDFPLSPRGEVLTLSGGAARLMPGDGVTVDTLLMLAQRALDAARAEPESRVMVASAESCGQSSVSLD